MEAPPGPDPDPPPRISRADMALRRRAARERWGVPPELMTETLMAALEILATSQDERHRLAAGRLVAALTRIDQVDDRIDLERAKTAPPERPDTRAALLAEALDIVRERETNP